MVQRQHNGVIAHRRGSNPMSATNNYKRGICLWIWVDVWQENVKIANMKWDVLRSIEMNIVKIKIENLKPAEYNPRIDLKPENIEYQKIHNIGGRLAEDFLDKRDRRQGFRVKVIKADSR